MVAYYVLFSLIRQLFLDKIPSQPPNIDHIIQSKNYYGDVSIARTQLTYPHIFALPWP